MNLVVLKEIFLDGQQLAKGAAEDGEGEEHGEDRQVGDHEPEIGLLLTLQLLARRH